LEWQTVFVCGLEQGLFPMRPMMTSTVDLEEERRLMYVAITRAKEQLHLLWTKERNRFGRMVRNRPSQFLAEMALSDKGSLLKTS
jgi:DNA helicase-2/ATP-dependent DNA helicase PcrA